MKGNSVTSHSIMRSFSSGASVQVEYTRIPPGFKQATADRNIRKAEFDDLRSQIYYDVRAAFLDLQATSEELQAATRGRDLSALQLTQARDRFAAGVANNIEVIQAQEAVALANEQYIDAVFGYNLSKAVLGRALGTVEEAIAKYLGGTN